MPIEKSFMMIKPDGLINDAVLDLVFEINKNELKIQRFNLVKLDTEIIKELYPKERPIELIQQNIDYLTSEKCGVLEVSGDNAIEKLLIIKGKTHHSGLRLKYASNCVQNTFHCPDNQQDYEKELDLFFSRKSK